LGRVGLTQSTNAGADIIPITHAAERTNERRVMRSLLVVHDLGLVAS
jgi:hypothetical protein